MTFHKGSIFSLFLLGSPVFAASPAIVGVGNLAQVDQDVYRGAQPTDEGFRNLAKLGVKVVLDLREHDARSLAEERIVETSGMRYVNVPMTGLTPPTEAETEKILTLLEDPSAGPVFVHCKRGADRTGAVIAAYRIDHDRWDNARALQEANDMGMGFIQFERRAFIRAFQARPAASAAVVAPAAP